MKTQLFRLGRCIHSGTSVNLYYSKNKTSFFQKIINRQMLANIQQISSIEWNIYGS